MRNYVLVVEADPDSRDAICESLADCGAPLKCASDCGSALAMLKGIGRPCVVVLSVAPHDQQSGARIAKALRTRSATADVPIVVLSTVSELRPFDDRTQVLLKPYEPDALLQIVCATTSPCISEHGYTERPSRLNHPRSRRRSTKTTPAKRSLRSRSGTSAGINATANKAHRS